MSMILASTVNGIGVYLNKTSAKTRLEFYKKYFGHVYVFMFDKKIRHVKKENVDFFTTPYYIYPFFFLVWFFQFLSIKNKKNIERVCFLDPVFGGLIALIFSKILQKPLVTRIGAQWEKSTIRAIRSKENNIVTRLSKLFILLHMKIIRPIALDNCRNIICNSSSVKVENKKCTIVYNGVDTKKFFPQDGSALKKELFKQDKKLVLGYLGRLDEDKGFGEIIKSIKNIKNDINLLVVGEGGLKKKYEKILPEAKFIGWVHSQEIPKYLAACDVVILTPPKDGTDSFPNTLLEAMACGKPVIGSRMGGIPEMIIDNQTGFLVEPENPKETEEAIVKLFNKSTRERMGKNARTHIINNFELNKQMNKLGECLSA